MTNEAPATCEAVSDPQMGTCQSCDGEGYIVVSPAAEGNDGERIPCVACKPYQPVSLPMRDQVAAMVDPYINDDGSHVSHLRWQIALERADAIIALIRTPEQPA